MGIVGLQERDVDVEVINSIYCEVMHLEMENLLTLGDKKGQVYKDSLTGQPLRPDLLRAARAKELAYFVSKNVWTKVPRAEAAARQGKPLSRSSGLT